MRTCWAVFAAVVCSLGCVAPHSANAQSSVDRSYEAAGNGLLNAVFQSKRGGMALIDGVAYRPGDRVDGAEILAIERGSIRLRTGDGDYTAWVGSELPDLAPLPVRPEQPPSPAVKLAMDPVGFDTEVHPSGNPADGSGATHQVAYGETLSAIALRYKPNKMSLLATISEIFGANRAIFGEDMDDLPSGVTLRIPSQFTPSPDPLIESIQSGVALASVEVETAELLGDAEPPPGEHVPVVYGDSLSVIAERIAPQGVSTQAVMRALYAANPHAFGDSMDMLFAGEVLRIPASYTLPAGFADGREALARLDRGTNADLRDD